jgi:hypothetical protein
LPLSPAEGGIPDYRKSKKSQNRRLNIMDAVKLYNKYTIEELGKMEDEIRSKPENRQDGFYIYTKKARKNLDAVAWAITYHIRENRIKKGEFIREDGYTGK